MKRITTMLAIGTTALFFAACGGGGSSSTPSGGANNPPPPTGNIVLEDNIYSFLQNSYSSKDKYETTEEYEARKIKTINEIKDTTFLFASDNWTFGYDADSEIGTYRIRFSHTQDDEFPDLINSGPSYEVHEYRYSNNWGHGYHSYEYVFTNPIDSELRAEKGNLVSCVAIWTHTIDCEVTFHATPEEAKNIDIGLKLSVNINSLDFENREFQLGSDTSHMEYNYYPAKFVSFVVYDENTNKELVKLVL